MAKYVPTRTRYVSLEVELDDWVVNALLEDGFFVRRGNQHMRGLYLTKKGSRWTRNWCIQQAIVGPRRADA